MRTHRPLARRLALLMTSLAAGSMLLGALAYGAYEYFSLRKGMVLQLDSQAAVIGQWALVPLRFENKDEARTVLASLATSRNFLRATLYKADGMPFASYPEEAGREEARPVDPKHLPPSEFRGGYLFHVTAIQTPDGTAGILCIQSGLGDFQDRMRFGLLVQALTLLVVIALVFLVSLRLQNLISLPILRLAKAARRVFETHDYSVRVEPEGDDEIQVLGRSFNRMVEAVEDRDEQLLRHRERLELEVAARTEELSATNDLLTASLVRAEDASTAKSAFLASMSHELRTPMNAILGYAQLMVRETGRGEKDVRQLNRVMQAGEHLLSLINDVLSVSRIEAGQMSLNPKPFLTRTLIQSVEDMIEVRTAAKGLSLDVEVDPRLPEVAMGDEGKLRQVLLNLMGNAVKFTEVGGIGLQIQCLDGDRVRFRVQDTGPGIAPEDLPRIFGSFSQAEAGRRFTEGAGLGLYISQAISHLMGGEITAQSELNAGSCFAFEIPLPPTEEAAKTQTPTRNLHLIPGQPPLKQLVVDDKENNRELLREFLMSLGLPVHTARNGREALEAWEAWRPDVVWMDLRMPDMDGMEATRRIRAREASLGRPRIPILAITASVFEEDRGEVLGAGCDAIIGKPFREEALFGALEAHAGLRFEEAGTAEPAHESTSIQGVPETWKQSFREALINGDTERADQLAKELPPPLEALATYIRRALHEFRLDELERLFAPPSEAP